MSDGLNSVHLLGNLGADPELRQVGSGQSVLRLRLATTSSYLDKNRERKESTEWHSLTVWGKRAEALARILGKGDRIFVDGAIRTSNYDDAEGKKRYRTEIVVQNVILCGGSRKPSRPEEDRSDYPRGEDEAGNYDDDIPF